jgi:hypothetical protein
MKEVIKNYKIAGVLALGIGLTLSASTLAESAVQEECILTGTIQRDADTPEIVRVSFTQIEHGELARCRARGTRGGMNRLQFAPEPGDNLAQLDAGTTVRYHYQRLDGEPAWRRMTPATTQLAKDVRDL